MAKQIYYGPHPECLAVPEGGLGANLCQVCKSLLAGADSFGLSPNLDDLQTTASLVTHAQTV